MNQGVLASKKQLWVWIGALRLSWNENQELGFGVEWNFMMEACCCRRISRWVLR